jgi:uncharacterized protein
MSEAPTLIDADFVPERGEIEQIKPYLSTGWREHLTTGGGLASSGYVLPSAPYRAPPSHHEDGTDAVTRALRYLDGQNVAGAVVSPGTAPALSGIANAVMAAELARATNDWLIGRWLERDERLHGSILVGPRDAELAAEEIERLGSHPQIAQVALAFPPCLLGDRSLYPLLAAAEESGLVLCLQAGGALVGSNAGPTPAGHPSSYVEYSIDSSYGCIPHLVSILVEGVFDRFPGLRLVLSGFGVAWLPSLVWRLEATATASASETIREHVRFTTRAIEEPTDPAHLWGLLSPIGGEALLLYASGEETEGASDALRSIPAELRERIGHTNAAEFLRLGHVSGRNDGGKA